jgi:hypothetical protein
MFDPCFLRRGERTVFRPEGQTAAGIWVSEVIDHGFIHSIYTFDPNGIPIEFSRPVDNLDPRSTPFMADRDPVKTALEGSEPQYEKWPVVARPTPKEERTVYPGAGSELFHGKKKSDDNDRNK